LPWALLVVRGIHLFYGLRTYEKEEWIGGISEEEYIRMNE
jgi:hypothetical protein